MKPRPLAFSLSLSLSLLTAVWVLAACATDIGPRPDGAPDEAEAVQAELEAEPQAPTEPPEANVQRWGVDRDASEITFTGSRPSIAHTRGFTRFDGRLHTIAREPVYVEVVVDMTSITAKADDAFVEHLKTADFFDVVRYPAARFRSTGVSAGSQEGMYTIEGLMEVHGKRVPLTFSALILPEGTGLRGQADLVLNRYDYDLDYQTRRDDSISASVTLHLDLLFTRAPDAQAQR